MCAFQEATRVVPFWVRFLGKGDDAPTPPRGYKAIEVKWRCECNNFKQQSGVYVLSLKEFPGGRPVWYRPVDSIDVRKAFVGVYLLASEIPCWWTPHNACMSKDKNGHIHGHLKRKIDLGTKDDVPPNGKVKKTCDIEMLPPSCDK